MYYHCRPIKYVEYGRVFPPPEDSLDWMLPAYKWLGHHCGYSPQIWLSRSHSCITGYRSSNLIKKSKFIRRKRSEAKVGNDSILLGFDVIKGFPVSYEHWNLILNACLSIENFDVQNKEIISQLNTFVGYYEENDEEPDRELADWVSSGRDLNTFLNNYVFMEREQVVVPSLNLKSAKKIICHNEKQKKTLLKKGFIEDRVIIKNLKSYSF